MSASDWGEIFGELGKQLKWFRRFFLPSKVEILEDRKAKLTKKSEKLDKILKARDDIDNLKQEMARKEELLKKKD